ncbi:MAG: hypothetical protein OCC49_15320 [Fibrobacterales bacterium]
MPSKPVLASIKTELGKFLKEAALKDAAEFKVIRDLKHRATLASSLQSIESSKLDGAIGAAGETGVSAWTFTGTGSISIKNLAYHDTDPDTSSHNSVKLKFRGNEFVAQPLITLYNHTGNDDMGVIGGPESNTIDNENCQFTYVLKNLETRDSGLTINSEKFNSSLKLNFSSTPTIKVEIAPNIIEYAEKIGPGIAKFRDFMVSMLSLDEDDNGFVEFLNDSVVWVNDFISDVQDFATTHTSEITIGYTKNKVTYALPLRNGTKLTLSQSITGDSNVIYVGFEDIYSVGGFNFKKFALEYRPELELDSNSITIKEVDIESPWDLNIPLFWNDAEIQMKKFGIRYVDESFLIDCGLHINPDWNGIPLIGDKIPEAISIKNFALGWGESFAYKVDGVKVHWKKKPNADKKKPPEEQYETTKSLEEGTVPVGAGFGHGLTIGGIALSKVTGEVKEDPQTAADPNDLKTISKSIGIQARLKGIQTNIGPIALSVDGPGIQLTVDYNIDDEDGSETEGLETTNTSLGYSWKNISLDSIGLDKFVDIGMRTELLGPTGYGIKIDSPTVTGAGYLSKEGDKYVGALALNLFNKLDITAVGVLETIDGKASFVILISSVFPTGIPLGLNFYLKGVGGLIGFNRTMNVEALRGAVRSGSLDTFAFPDLKTESLSTVVNNLQNYFPAKAGQFVVGPLAKIEWSNPALLTLDAGILVEVPDPVRLAILGVVRTAIPNKDRPLLTLNAAFLGMIDFDKGMLSFDASLFNSKLLTFELFGDLCVRLSWGNKKGFVISAGGFHPSYTVPTYLDIPEMRRMTIVFYKQNPKVMLESYFAVTSNTVQLGALASLSYKKAGANVSGHLGFNTLFQFDPFAFMADFSCGVSVKVWGFSLFDVSLTGELSGPTPWHIYGKVRVSLGWLGSVTAKVSVTWGDENKEPLQQIALQPLLDEELQRSSNWSITAGRDEDVSYRDHGIEGVLYLAPNGDVTFNQEAIPFAEKLDCFGNAKPIDFKRFTFSEVSIGDIKANTKKLNNSFPSTLFKDLSGKQGMKDRLSAADFKKYTSGFSAKGNWNGVFEDEQVVVHQTYEIKEYTHRGDPQGNSAGLHLEADIFTPFEVAQMVEGIAVARTDRVQEARLQVLNEDFYTDPPREQFDIVLSEDLSLTEMQGLSFTEAHALIDQLVENEPMLAGELAVVANRGTHVNG